MTATDGSGTASPEETSDSANLGAMLRQAREQRNLSVIDLATCLRLDPRIVERLEANRFDLLPAPAFIRGYVRSIAKELEIDSTPLITVFNLRFDEDPPGLSDFETRAPTQITSDSNIIRYTTIGLCIVMLMMVALWWQARDTDLENGQTKALAPAPVAPATDPLPYEFDVVSHSDDPFYRAPTPVLPAAIAPAMDTVEDEPETEAMTVAAPSAAEIEIITLEDAWIEIVDQTNTRLHYSIAKPDRPILIEGEAPYRVIIGNAPAVHLRFRGKDVDLEPHSSDGIARLSLGPN